MAIPTSPAAAAAASTRPTNLDTFTTAYITAMLWAECPTESDESCDDLGLTVDDITDEGLREIIADCDDFQLTHANDIADDLERAGHDFYLTRNRHGAGFWDGDWPVEVSRRLTDAAHVYGTQGLQADDEDGNGPLHVHG